MWVWRLSLDSRLSNEPYVDVLPAVLPAVLSLHLHTYACTYVSLCVCDGGKNTIINFFIFIKKFFLFAIFSYFYFKDSKCMRIMTNGVAQSKDEIIMAVHVCEYVRILSMGVISLCRSQVNIYIYTCMYVCNNT